MKIRTDFVTNSSSSSFILPVSEEIPSLYDAVCKYIDCHNTGVKIAEGALKVIRSFSGLQDCKDLSIVWKLERDGAVYNALKQYLASQPIRLHILDLEWLSDDDLWEYPDKSEFGPETYQYDKLPHLVVDHLLAPDEYLDAYGVWDEAVWWYSDYADADYSGIIMQYADDFVPEYDEDVAMTTVSTTEVLQEHPELRPACIRSLGRFGFYKGEECMDQALVKGLAQISNFYCNHMG